MKKTIVIVYDGAVINGGAAKIAIQSAVELAKNPDINMIYFAANVVLLPFVKQRLRKEKGFADFVENYIPHTEKVVNVEQLKALVDWEQYRAIITGSDQVWNPHIFDFDEMFFFPFETKAIKIGYSVSIGESSLEDIRGYSKYAKDFPYVGLREKGAKEKVEAICGHSVVDTVDPVLLLTREDWETFVDKSSPLAKEKYLFCYLIDKKPIKQNMAIAEQIAKERGLKIKYIWILDLPISNLPAGTTPCWYEMTLCNFGYFGYLVGIFGLIGFCYFADGMKKTKSKSLVFMLILVLLTQNTDVYVVYILFIFMYYLEQHIKHPKIVFRIGGK